MSAYDDKAGKFISAPLNVKRLKKTAIPSVFPGYPASCSFTTSISRQSPNKKRQTRENNFVNRMLIESVECAETYYSERNISNFEDILCCIKKFGIPSSWNVSTNENFLCLMYI